jgi:hypothetical protein
MPRKKRITKKVLFTKTVEILQSYLNLKDWRIIIRYSSRMKNTADCAALPEYKQAVIRCNTKDLSGLTHYDIVSVAIHEMVHCLLWPLTDWTETLCKNDITKLSMTSKIEESIVTNFEKILVVMAETILKQELSNQGYADIDLVFTEFQTHTERVLRV